MHDLEGRIRTLVAFPGEKGVLMHCKELIRFFRLDNKVQLEDMQLAFSKLNVAEEKIMKS